MVENRGLIVVPLLTGGKAYIPYDKTELGDNPFKNCPEALNSRLREISEREINKKLCGEGE